MDTLVDDLRVKTDDAENQPPSVQYVQHLPLWRTRLRSALLARVEKESEIIGRLQYWARTPFLDAYFTYSSLLGTDSFFLLSLPVFFFFGYDELGRGLLIILAIGAYGSSFLKDLCCTPRPYSPPVTRLTVLNHHLEYGFPSTHTTHSFSIALYLCMNTTSPYYWTMALYAFTIIFGRIYLGMHSFTDCAVGIALGTISVVIQSLPFMRKWERWTFQGGLEVPVILVVGLLLLLEGIPMPVDDCPCYDDAVLSGAVALGALLGRWRFGVTDRSMDIMQGSGWVLEAGKWVIVPNNALIWWGTAALKMIIGMVIVFAWRFVGKATLKRVFRIIRVPSKTVSGVGGHIIYRHRSDTLTKVVIYTGIALICCDVMPDLFIALGLGVKSWP